MGGDGEGGVARLPGTGGAALGLRPPRGDARGATRHPNPLRRLAVRLMGDALISLVVAGAEGLRERFAEALRESFCAKLS